MTRVRSEILLHMRQVAKEQRKCLSPLTDELPLANSGLDSLGLAILVARLEESLGFDPFTESRDAYFPVTVGDFIRFYEDAHK